MIDKKKIKLLHIIASLERGGAETQLRILLEHVNTKKFQNSVLVCHKVDNLTSIHDRADIIFVERGNKWNFLSFWRRVYKQVLSNKPDILHLWLPPLMTIPALAAGLRLRCKIISSQRDSYNFLKPHVNFIAWLNQRFFFIQHFFADKIISNFPVERESFMNRMLYKNRSGEFVPNALSSRINKDDIKTSYGISGAFKILFVARLTSKKRLDLLIKSVSRLKSEGGDIQLEICGSGSEKSEYKSMALKLGLDNEINFHGYLPNWHFLAKASDIFVLPSMYEGSPNSLIEAMCLGLPSIAVKLPGISFFGAHGKNILFVEAGSELSLYSAIKKLMQSSELRANLGRNAAKIPSFFKLEEYISAHERVYQQLSEVQTR